MKTLEEIKDLEGEEYLSALKDCHFELCDKNFIQAYHKAHQVRMKIDPEYKRHCEEEEEKERKEKEREELERKFLETISKYFSYKNGFLHIHICKKDSKIKESIKRGFERFIGNKAEWIQEYEKLVSWLKDNKGRGLVLKGGCGRGKTVFCHYLSWVLKCYRQSFVYCDAYDMPKIFDKLKNDLVEDKTAPDILIIDDVGTEPTMRFGEPDMSFFRIVDFCEKESVLLVVSTNLTVENIKDRYGVRALDRLVSLTTTVTFEGKSFRGR